MVTLSNPKGMALKLWIDMSSHLILRASDELSKATIRYQPKTNVPLAASEFAFTPGKQ